MSLLNDKRVNLYLLIIISCLTSRCTNIPSGYSNITEFYFPLYDLKEGMFYEYECDDEIFPNEYIFMQLKEDKEGKYLIFNQYDGNLNKIQSSREDILSNGTRLTEMSLYSHDENGTTDHAVEINHGNQFPFWVKDSLGIFVTNLSIEWDDSTQISIIRNKKFAGLVNYNWEGVEQDAVLLQTRQLTTQHQNGDLEVEGSGKQWFVKNIGLVAYEKYFDENNRLFYELKHRYDTKTFQSKFGIK